MKTKFYRLNIIVLSALLVSNFRNSANAQFNEDEKLLPDLSAGLKTLVGRFEYGPKYFETTSSTVGFQPTIRYDYPIRLFTIREKTFYLSFTASTGVLYIPNKKKTYQDIDPFTGQTVEYQSKSPFYIPFYFGFYNPGPFGLGVEAFYAKGLNGISDIWGGKMIGLSYNHTKFRINAAYELAVAVKYKVDDPIGFFSIDFLWKLNRRED
jgi:hypothetical protein